MHTYCTIENTIQSICTEMHLYFIIVKREQIYTYSVTRMFKVAFFAIERVAEPISNQIEKVASRSPWFQKTCINISKRFRKDKEKQWHLTGFVGSDWKVPTIDNSQAVTMGCEILGEGIVWSIGLGILAYTMHQDDVAEEVQNQKLSDMREQINEINKQMKDMKNTQIKLLQIIEEQTRDPPKKIPQKRSSWWY